MATPNDNPNNPVVWFEIYVDDLDRAQKFYEAILNLKLESMDDPTNMGIKMAGFPFKQDKPNSTGALIQMEGFKAGGNSTLVYFDSEDCSIEEARVTGAGGKVFKKKFSIGKHGFISICVDTEGNMFGLYSMK